MNTALHANQLAVCAGDASPAKQGAIAVSRGRGTATASLQINAQIRSVLADAALTDRVLVLLGTRRSRSTFRRLIDYRCTTWAGLSYPSALAGLLIKPAGTMGAVVRRFYRCLIHLR